MALTQGIGTATAAASDPIKAKLITPIEDRGFEKTKRGTMRQRVELGTLRGLDDRAAGFVFRDVPQPYLIGSGLESKRVTAPPSK